MPAEAPPTQPAPVSPETPEGGMGEVALTVPVIEEEIVVRKRPVVKEVLRITREVVEEEEMIEVDLRKEEVDVEDTSGTARGV